MTYKRREFLMAGVSACALGALPSRFTWAETAVDVVVIGGGLAGLSTAHNLLRNGVESVVALEARDRVGGRTLNLPLPNKHIVEGGGEWIGPRQDRIAEFAAEMGVDTFDAYYEGEGLYEIQGLVSQGLLPDISVKHGHDFIHLATKLQRMANQLPAGKLWKAINANELDNITLGKWLHSQGASAWTFETFRIITRAIMSGYPERISLLWFLHYIQSSGGLLNIALNDNGLQDLRFVGGSQLVSINATKALKGRVHLNEPVEEISDHGRGQVEVLTAKGVTASVR